MSDNSLFWQPRRKRVYIIENSLCVGSRMESNGEYKKRLIGEYKYDEYLNKKFNEQKPKTASQ